MRRRGRDGEIIPSIRDSMAEDIDTVMGQNSERGEEVEFRLWLLAKCYI